jgi:hypothetical protein
MAARTYITRFCLLSYLPRHIGNFHGSFQTLGLALRTDGPRGIALRLPHDSSMMETDQDCLNPKIHIQDGGLHRSHLQSRI